MIETDIQFFEHHRRRNLRLRRALPEESARLVVVQRLRAGMHWRLLKELGPVARALAHRPDRASDADCQKVLEEILPPQRSAGQVWNRVFTPGRVKRPSAPKPPTAEPDRETFAKVAPLPSVVDLFDPVG
jgi:hypothetical protein